MVFILNGENFRVRIQLFGALNKLTDSSVLNHYHRLLGGTETAHLHSCAYERKCLSCTNLVCE